MTSNVGADILRKQGSLGFKTDSQEVTYKDMKERLLDQVKKTFKPEFLNRIDDTIVFHSFTKDDLYKIIEIEMEEVKARLKEQGVEVTLDQSAKEILVEKGFDPVFGARPLKRTIQRLLEDPLAEDIISKRFVKGKPVKAFAENGKLVFK